MQNRSKNSTEFSAFAAYHLLQYTSKYKIKNNNNNKKQILRVSTEQLKAGTSSAKSNLISSDF